MGIAAVVAASIGFATQPAAPVAHASAPAADASMRLVLLRGSTAEVGSLPKDFKELARPPWSAFNRYEIVSDEKLGMTLNASVQKPLPDGSLLDLTLLASVDKGASLKLSVDVHDSTGRLTSKGRYQARRTSRFMPVSLPYKKGLLVVSLEAL